MSRLRELMEELCPDGVEYKQLGEIGTLVRGKRFVKNDFADIGVPAIHYGEMYTYYGISSSEAKTKIRAEISSKMRYAQTNDVIIVGAGETVEDIGIGVAWLGKDDVAVHDACYIFRHNMNPIYVSYLLRTESYHKQIKKYITTGKISSISAQGLAKAIIPVPPVTIQNEIVKVLDNFTKATTELTEKLAAELEMQKKQYNFYRDSLLNFVRVDDTIVQTDRQTDRQAQRISKFGRIGQRDIVWKTLGDIGSVCMCKRILKQQTNTEYGIPFYKIGTFGQTADSYISEELFSEYKEKYSYPRKGEILISAAGTIGRTVIYDGTPAYFQDSNIVWIANDESIVLNRYLYYFYSLFPWRVADGGTIARLYNDQIRRTNIPVPPLTEQHRIVSMLDRFDALCNDLTQGLSAEIAARRKQYEYYRDKLLNFRRKGS